MPDSVRSSSRPRQGRSFSFLADILPASQWTANLRAERDLLRQLVPVISPGRIENGDRDSDDSSQSDPLSLSLHSISHVRDPHPNRLPIPDDNLSSTGRIEDANADFFDKTHPDPEGERPKGSASGSEAASSWACR